MSWQNLAKRILPALVLAVAAARGAHATQLVTNGSFESTTNGPGQLGYNTNVTGWTTSGYNFVFASGTADTTGATGRYGGVMLWGPNNGSANGLPASSPDGGNFIAADGAFQVGAISQTINGLTAGDTYQVSFYWAGAQQYGFTGTNTEQWQVNFGSQSQSTAVYHNTSEGFSGWMLQTFNFTADGTSDVLSFLAIGTPSGVPPFSLLDGVSVQQVALQPTPEPATVTLAAVGMLGLGAAARRRRARSTSI